MATVPSKIAKGWKKQHKDRGGCERNICILFAELTKSVQYSWAKSVLRQFARAGIWYNPLDSLVTRNLWDKKKEIWGILYNLQHPTYHKNFNTTHKISAGPGKGLLATFNVCGKEGSYRNMPSHVEANHITCVSHSCYICGKISRSRDNFRHQKKPCIMITHISRSRDGVIFQKQKHHTTAYTERKGLRKHKVKDHCKLRNVWNKYNLIKPDVRALLSKNWEEVNTQKLLIEQFGDNKSPAPSSPSSFLSSGAFSPKFIGGTERRGLLWVGKVLHNWWHSYTTFSPLLLLYFHIANYTL